MAIDKIQVWDGVRYRKAIGKVMTANGLKDFYRPIDFKTDFVTSENMIRQTAETLTSESVETNFVNLFSQDGVNNLAVGGSTINGTILRSSRYRGYYIPVKPGEIYSISRDSIINNRFDYGFTVEEPEDGVPISEGSISYRNDLSISNIVVPEGFNWLFLYLSNQADDIPNIVISKKTAPKGSVIPVRSAAGFNIGELITITDGFNSENVVILGRNRLINSNDFSNQATYQGSTYRIEENFHVPEWGAEDATRVIASGGSSNLKLTPTVSYKTSARVTYSVWVKNNGNNTFRMRFNGLTGASEIYFEVGEQKRIVVTGNLRDNYVWFQRQFWTMREDDVIDVVLWREKLEDGDNVTDWTPAPEDLYDNPDNALSVSEFKNNYPRNSIVARSTAKIDGAFSYGTRNTYNIEEV